MRKFYGPPIPGSISPVPATEEMTEPVGIKDGQLWTKGPDGGLEERVETLETDVGNLQETATEHGTAINNLEIDMTDAENDISGLQNRMTSAESNIGTNAQAIGQLEFNVSQAQTDIVGLGLSKLDKPTNEGETGDVIVKTANGTEYQSVAPFNPNGTYPNVTAGKAISAKSLENVSEDSGATQTAPFFFQATATANNTEETPTAPVFELKSIRGNTIVYNQLVDGMTTTYPTISGHTYWAFHSGQPPVIVVSQGTPISFPSPQSDKLVDLTRWFNGSIPQAIIDNPSVFPANYYDGALTYSAGELKNCSCTELKTVGFNQWDEVFGVSFDGRYGSQNFIRVVPNVLYLFREPSVQLFGIKAYDNNQDAISNVVLTSIGGGMFTFTTPSNCEYIKFNLGSGYGTTYKHDICINLVWDGERNGEYSPYISHTYPMVYSGKSAGSAYDEKLPDGKEITRIGSVDLGSLAWFRTGSGLFQTNAPVSGMKPPSSNSVYANVICHKYTVAHAEDMYGPLSPTPGQDMAIGVNTSGYLYVNDTNYTDATDFKTAMDGILAWFELATPTTSEGTSYTSEIEGDDYGTMAFDSVVPVGNEFFYPADYSLLIDDLGNYTGYDVTKLMLKTDNVVPAAPTSDGTYVLKCVVSGGTPSYSWIAET